MTDFDKAPLPIDVSPTRGTAEPPTYLPSVPPYEAAAGSCPDYRPTVPPDFAAQGPSEQGFENGGSCAWDASMLEDLPRSLPPSESDQVLVNGEFLARAWDGSGSATTCDSTELAEASESPVTGSGGHPYLDGFVIRVGEQGSESAGSHGVLWSEEILPSDSGQTEPDA